MSPREKLDAIEELWDSVSRDEKNVPSPEWHAQILAARKERVASGQGKFLTVQQLKAQFGRE
jgi:hypothetical protein